MRSLVVYDSFFSNTKQIAEVIAGELSCKAIRVSSLTKDMLNDLDLLVVGSPIRGWRPTEEISAFFESIVPNSLDGVYITSFDTRVKLFIHGDAKNKIITLLERAGGKLLTKPEAFYVKGTEGPLLDGEIDKALKWAKEIKGGIR